MIESASVLLVGTGVAYGTSRLVPDGILGGMLLLMTMLLTTRGVMGGGGVLHPVNAWVTFGLLAGYAVSVYTLPNCTTDRYGSRFCRATNPASTGFTWIDRALAGFLGFGGVIVSVGTPVHPVSRVAVVGMMLASLAAAVIHYGMYGPPVTVSEKRHIHHRGGIVDTNDMAVRILPGYTRTPGPEGASRYSLLG